MLILVVVVVGILGVTAAAAVASGPSSLGVSGWQIYASSTQYNNPTSGVQTHGWPGEYAGAPATPSENDSGWVNCGSSAPKRFNVNMCPSATTIGMGVTSVLGGCWSKLNFTWFQALVSIPTGTNVSQFSVNMNGADDGARVALYNSSYPNGVTPTAGFIYSGTPQATGDLSPYVVAGEVNRVVITQVDDCAVGNNLNTAQVFLNGTVIVPDTSAPTDAPVFSPAANANGWNNSDVSVAWNWTDGGTNPSGIDTSNCTQSGASSGEGTQTLAATCKDLAGNTRSDSRSVKVDKTAPADSPVTTINGNTVSVAWHWTDGLSGIDSSNCQQTSSQTGSGSTTVTSTCYDRAGNASSDSVTAQLDSDPPTDNPSAIPAWSNSDVTVNWNWSDSGSGIDPSNCTQSSTSSGEGTIVLTSTCSDLAGNSATDRRKVHVDETAPSASPDVPAGWQTSDATVNWNWSDSGSGIDASNCTQSSTSSGDGTITLTATCTDIAGNTGSASATVQVDSAAPTDAPSAVPAWSNSDVTVNWNWSDSGSGIDPANCTQSSTSSGEGTVTLTTTCADIAGNSSSDSIKVHVDKTAPSASPVAPSGWQTSDATAQWNWTDGGSGIDPANCTQSTTSSGEGASTLLATCTDAAGNTGSASVTVMVDKTAPSASPVGPSSWQNTDATVAWNWTDAASGSGIDASHCTQSSTSSGEGTITLHATCTDVAGNTGSASATVQVDKTAPSAAPAGPTGWQNTDATVAWNWTDGTSGIDAANCTQSSTSSGEGTITLNSTCSDIAGNSASASATVKVDKTNPTVTYTGGGTYTVDQNVSVTCTAADAGGSGLASNTCANVSGAAWQLGLGTHNLSATATDNAGNSGSGSTSYTVKVDADSLCALVTKWAKNSGQANSLCVKLRAAADAAARGQAKTHDNNINAFDNEVSAQSGKGFTAAQATLLIQFAAAL